MWICRRCAAHVRDDAQECPCCTAPAPARLQPELVDHVTEEAKDTPSRWLPSFEDRKVIKGEGWFIFSIQVVVLLIAALMILALLSSLGLSTPASDGLALFFLFVICLWIAGFLAWNIVPIVIKQCVHAGKEQSNILDVEDRFSDELFFRESQSNQDIEAPSADGVKDIEN